MTTVQEELSKNGRPAYTLLDVAKAEHATRKWARR